MCGQWLSTEPGWMDGWMDGGFQAALGSECKNIKLQECGLRLSPSGEERAGGLLSNGVGGRNLEGMDTGHLISQVLFIEAGEDGLLITIK